MQSDRMENNCSDSTKLNSTKSGCCSLGRGGPWKIEPAYSDENGFHSGDPHPWHILWLPKGYAITKEDFIICLVSHLPDEDWSDYGLRRGKRPPLIEAICETIERYMRDRANA